MEDQNVAFRLKGFIDSQGLSSSQFADLCGIPRPSLSQLLTGRNKKISDILVGQIHKAFPKLSILWLLFGEGEMLISNKNKEENASPSGPGSSDGEFRELKSLLDPPEIPYFPDNFPDYSLRSNLMPLEDEAKYKKLVENMRVEADKRIADLQAQIEHLRSNPRKVAQITVYYDDSTFETFFSR